DRDAKVNHRPASSLADSLANDHGDPGTEALWAAHRARLEREVGAIRVSPPGVSRIDAWIDPPPYAGLPALVVDFKTADPQTLKIPEDSILVVRGDPSLVETRVEGAITQSEQKNETPASTASGEKSAAPANAPPASAAAANAPTEKRWTVQGPGKVTILRGGQPAAIAILAVTPA